MTSDAADGDMPPRPKGPPVFRPFSASLNRYILFNMLLIRSLKTAKILGGKSGIAASSEALSGAPFFISDSFAFAESPMPVWEPAPRRLRAGIRDLLANLFCSRTKEIRGTVLDPGP